MKDPRGKGESSVMRTHEFLNLYKTLEETLEERYERQGRRYISVVMEFMNSPEGAEWREQMDICREIRNLMTHTADVSGEPVVTPAQGVVDALREIVEYVQRPPMALNYATPAEKILKTSPAEPVLPLMRAMSKRGFSHVPVMSGDRVAGVFSISTVFSGVMRDRPSIDEDTRVCDFSDILPADRHLAEQFLFLSGETTLPEARAAFDLGSQRRKRVAALFLTSGGGENGRLLGMLTPWDVLRRED